MLIIKILVENHNVIQNKMCPEFLRCLHLMIDYIHKGYNYKAPRSRDAYFIITVNRPMKFK